LRLLRCRCGLAGFESVAVGAGMVERLWGRHLLVAGGAMRARERRGDQTGWSWCAKSALLTADRRAALEE
jgi:hypothetical protein